MRVKNKKSPSKLNSRMVNDEILFEMGPGTLHWLEENNVDVEQIKYVIISNFKAEHFSDIAAFLLSRLEVEDPNLITIIGPDDILQRVSALMILFDNNMDNNNVMNIERTYNVKFVGLANELYEDGKIKVQRVTTKTVLNETQHYNITYCGEKLKYETYG